MVNSRLLRPWELCHHTDPAIPTKLTPEALQKLRVPEPSGECGCLGCVNEALPRGVWGWPSPCVKALVPALQNTSR